MSGSAVCRGSVGTARGVASGSSSAAGWNDSHGRGRGRGGRVTSSGKAAVGGANAGINQVLKPRASVELAVDGVDEVRVLAARWRRDDVHGNYADDWLRVRDRGGVCRDPADDDGVGRVPDVELLEVDLRLLALADLELGEVRESGCQERKGNGGGALWARVDEGAVEAWLALIRSIVQHDDGP